MLEVNANAGFSSRGHKLTAGGPAALLIDGPAGYMLDVTLDSGAPCQYGRVDGNRKGCRPAREAEPGAVVHRYRPREGLDNRRDVARSHRQAGAAEPDRGCLMATSLSGLARYNAYVSVAASQTDSSVVAATTGKRIRVVALTINQGDTTPSAVTFNTKPAGAGAAIFPALKGAANGLLVLPLVGSGWFETATSEGLTVTTGAGSTSSVVVVYEIIPK